MRAFTAPCLTTVSCLIVETGGDRTTIVARRRTHYERGRRFVLKDAIEQGDRVAVAVTILNPEWSGPVKAFKVFTFRANDDVVVLMNDCIDESYARQVLAA